MAETLLKYVTKRRNRSSDGSVDGRVNSPESKKAKSTSDPDPDLSVESDEHEDSDIVLTALELTDDLNGILKGILEKLKKLDTIESTVKKIEGSLDKLEERTKRLEALEITAREDIDNLKINHSLIEKNLDDANKALDKKIQNLDGKVADLQDKEKKINQVLEDLNTKDLYLEAYSRRENIKFNNIAESPSPRNGVEDTEEVLRTFLDQQLGYRDARSVEIQRVHRLGKRKEDGERDQFSQDSCATKTASKYSLWALVSEVLTFRCLGTFLKNWSQEEADKWTPLRRPKGTTYPYPLASHNLTNFL